MLIVLSTCSTAYESENLSTKIVDSRLAACVQIVPQITSIYLWEGKVQRETEYMLIIKTLPEKWDELRELIIKEHSYSVPEIVSICSEDVSGPYHSWLHDTLVT